MGDSEQSGGIWPSSAGETEPGGLVPPYEGRSTGFGDSEAGEELEESVERQHAQSTRGNPGATASPAEESPVGEGEATAGAERSPGGVGESLTRGGEQVARQESEPGRTDLGTQGRSQRPVGTSDARSSTGVDPQNPRDDDMPDQPAGDQGG